jgi:2-succinyl-5-enolpyruvyl-6-hydroxy-3-cyclohexene-1-carboxylate synthase
MYTPHTVDLASLAAAYGWSYTAVATMAELTEAVTGTETHLLVDVSLPRD